MDPALFAGRRNEFRTLIRCLYNRRHILITGPAGIGKSSLANQLFHVAKGNMELLSRLDISSHGVDFNFVVLDFVCASTTTYDELISNLLHRAETNLSTLGIKVDETKSLFKLNLGLVSYEQQMRLAPDIRNITEQFIDALAHLWDKVAVKGKTGLLIVIDEADRIADRVDLASFSKVLTEALPRRGLQSFSLVFVGREDALQKLRSSHPSAPRIFEEVVLDSMDQEEMDQLLTLALKQAKPPTTISSAVSREIGKLAEGFPHLVHLIGSACFQKDLDGHIDKDDLEQGLDHVVTETRRLTLEQKWRDAGEGSYQEILKTMAQVDDDEVSVKTIVDMSGIKQNVVSARMQVLTKREQVRRLRRGIFCIADRLYKVYIRKFKINGSGNRSRVARIRGQ
jgi:GTPase SAR1 family protein